LEVPEAVLRTWIETFQAQTRLDLLPLWLRQQADGCVEAGPAEPALADPWGAQHRPDWHARGLLSWPRGGRWQHLRLELPCPSHWRAQQRGDRQARLVMRWWADAMELRVDGRLVHGGDLFDSGCRWLVPQGWWQGEPLHLELRLRSPLHDDGALIKSYLELEPTDPADPAGLLRAQSLALAAERLTPEQQQVLQRQLASLEPATSASGEALAPWLQAASRSRPDGCFHLFGHAHLDLAWLWPVADTWQAAIRTFESALALLERHPQLHFAHSSPALYAWIERHRPALFARIRAAMRAGRWEPINGPWVESDCVLISTASLLRQFQLGQAYSRAAFPEWRHELCWLPDSFGFGAGLPTVAEATGVRWFCTHKLAWNATNPFPHRLFRWRSRCGAELLALMTASIGTDGDPLAMERYRLEWQAGTGLAEALWLPGVGDHGGGPTEEMLQQLELWQQQPLACPQRHGTLRSYLEQLEPLAPQLPIWRDELYLELHRGCSTSRPDQKRHNRSLERLLRQADQARALLALAGEAAPSLPAAADWMPLLFQQFHDILPGTSIPEVFEQAEPQWRAARRRARALRDQALQQALVGNTATATATAIVTASVSQPQERWWLVALQPAAASPLTLRLPRGAWSLPDGDALPRQRAVAGGDWVQVPVPAGVAAVSLLRQPAVAAAGSGLDAAAAGAAVEQPVHLEPLAAAGGARCWRLSNGRLQVDLGPEGVRQLWGEDGRPQLAAPLQWCRWRDHGEFWDAWDIAADYRDHPLPLSWEQGPELVEQGPLCVRLVWRGRGGGSALRLAVQLRAACPWLELHLSVDWRQRHELLRLEIPLAQPAARLAADTTGGVLERPADPATAREQARWELPAISWLASQAQDPAAGGLAVLLDGPQGVSVRADRLGVSLLRAPTWPDPGADQGWHRLRLALLPCSQGWRQSAVPQQARRFREPLWLRPAHAANGQAWPALRLGSAALDLLGLEAADRPGEAWLTLQNLSPCRQRLQLPPAWQLLEGDPLLGPWQLRRLRISRRDHRMDR
jgi:alpha-mannosidase